MGGTGVGDFDFEDHRVAFGRRAVATAKCLDGDKISIAIDVDGLFKVIAGGAWVRLITRCCGGNVGDHVAALTNIDGAFEGQRC